VVGQHAGPVTDSNLILSLLPAVLFVNPAAGGGRALSCLARIRHIFEAARFPAEFITTANVDELQARARAAIKDGKRLLLALGGDGTLQGLVNAAYGADVILGILPGGGGNDFADALGLPHEGAAAARAILTGQPRWVDVARARMADGHERLYVGGGGLGIDAEAARHARGALRRLPGRARYIVSALRALCSYRPPKVRAEFPQSDLPPIEMNALLAAVLNTATYGAGIRLAPEARIDDGWLDFAMLEERSLASTLGLLPGLLRNGELHTTRMKRVRAQKIRLSSSPECMFHGDGEILGPTPVEIEVVPQAVRVLAPAQI